jgi:hypothetical protein
MHNIGGGTSMYWYSARRNTSSQHSAAADDAPRCWVFHNVLEFHVHAMM